MDINEALGKLDPKNDDHWTSDGLPRLDTLKVLAQNPALTREAVTAAAPGFNRTSAPQGPAAGAPPPPSTPPSGGTPNGAPSAPKGPAATDELPNLGEQVFAQADLDDLDKEIEALQADLQAKTTAVEDAKLAMKRVQSALDTLLERKAKLAKPGQDHQNAIQGYLAQQRANLAKRAERNQLIRDTGIDIKALARGMRAPIDAVRQRQLGHGLTKK